MKQVILILGIYAFCCSVSFARMPDNVSIQFSDLVRSYGRANLDAQYYAKKNAEEFNRIAQEYWTAYYEFKQAKDEDERSIGKNAMDAVVARVRDHYRGPSRREVRLREEQHRLAIKMTVL